MSYPTEWPTSGPPGPPPVGPGIQVPPGPPVWGSWEGVYRPPGTPHLGGPGRGYFGGPRTPLGDPLGGGPRPPWAGAPPGGRPGARGPGGVHFRGYLITLPVGTDVGIRNRKGWFSGGQKSPPGRPGAQNRPPGAPPGPPREAPLGGGPGGPKKGVFLTPPGPPKIDPFLGSSGPPWDTPRRGHFPGPGGPSECPRSVYPRRPEYPLAPRPQSCHHLAGSSLGSRGRLPLTPGKFGMRTLPVCALRRPESPATAGDGV